jgi:hypothetical protein
MSASPPSLHADGSDRRSTVTLSGLLDASGQAVPDGTLVALTATSGASVVNGFGVPSFGGQILGGTPSPTASFYRVFEVTDGQIVCEYSASEVTVSSGQQTATVQVVAVGRDGTRISTTAIATLPIPLVAPAAGLITSVPSDLLADGSARLSQVTIDEMLDAAGNPLADGSRVALTAVSGAATSGGFGIASAGGALLSAGVTPGDGAPAGNNGNYRIFTVAGGEVRAAYSAEGLKAGVSQTLVARISLVPASSAGNVLSTVAVSIGTVNLRGTTSATASGPASLSRAGAGQTGTVTFSGIKDSAGNTVPDGTPLIVTVASCGTVNGGFCVTSVGGTILDGTTSPSGGHLKVFAALGGQVTATYSTVGSSGPGTASVQVQPAASDGTRIGSQVLSGGIWAIQVTP